jgi:hypothetical protein
MLTLKTVKGCRENRGFKRGFKFARSEFGEGIEILGQKLRRGSDVIGTCKADSGMPTETLELKIGFAQQS